MLPTFNAGSPGHKAHHHHGGCCQHGPGLPQINIPTEASPRPSYFWRWLTVLAALGALVALGLK